MRHSSQSEPDPHTCGLSHIEPQAQREILFRSQFGSEQNKTNIQVISPRGIRTTRVSEVFVFVCEVRSCGSSAEMSVHRTHTSAFAQIAPIALALTDKTFAVPLLLFHISEVCCYKHRI